MVSLIEAKTARINLALWGEGVQFDSEALLLRSYSPHHPRAVFSNSHSTPLNVFGFPASTHHVPPGLNEGALRR